MQKENYTMDAINTDIIEWLMRPEVSAVYKEICKEEQTDRLFDFVFGTIYLHPRIIDLYLMDKRNQERYDEKMRRKLYSVFANVYRKSFNQSNTPR